MAHKFIINPLGNGDSDSSRDQADSGLCESPSDKPGTAGACESLCVLLMSTDGNYRRHLNI